MAMMDRKRTLSMDWDDLGDDDEDDFFDSTNRISVVAPSDVVLSDSDDDADFEDTRMSFSALSTTKGGSFRSYAAATKHGSFGSCVGSPSIRRESFRNFPASPSMRRESFRYSVASPSIRRDSFRSIAPGPSGRPDDPFGPFAPAPSSRRDSFGSNLSFRQLDPHEVHGPNYDIWMAAPGSIRERRKKLFAGMGLDSNKQLLKENSLMFSRKITRKLSNMPVSLPPASPAPTIPKPAAKTESHVHSIAPPPAAASSSSSTATSSSSPASPPPPPRKEPSKEEVLATSELHPEHHHQHVFVELVRSRSDGDIDWETHETTRKRKKELLGKLSKHRLTRTHSEMAMHARIVSYVKPRRMVAPSSTSSSPTHPKNGHKGSLSTALSTNQFGAFFLIKNLDTGKEFIVNEYDRNGMWNKFSDVQTGKKLTAEEFEKSVGYSPIVKELMRRQNKGNENTFKKFAQNSYISKSIRLSTQRGAALLKNLSTNFKESMKIGDKDHPSASPDDPKGNKSNSSHWVKVRQTGKQYKDLSALHMSQEIQAHEGSIWSMRFSLDGRYLASAGEDMIIQIWEVQECEMTSKLSEEGSVTPLHPSAGSPAHPSLGDAQQLPSEKRNKKGNFLPAMNKKVNPGQEYAQIPETIFALTDNPICSFEGHREDVLDLSWSKSQMLLSSSMDKTVRLWDLKTKSCVRTFTHSDYVTCIHFNPADDSMFISGSLDEKVRMWNIRNRRLVTYADVYEMVTAVCYSPNGQEVLIGTHKGNCRVYATEDRILEEKKLIETQKKNNQPKKITAFQFAPGNPCEVLVTSADSRIRILDDEDVVHKFIGFRNTSSQIAASFSTDGKYVICPSEDSQVYVFRREEGPIAGTVNGKPKVLTRSYEHFSCKDVSVAIPWPFGMDGEAEQPKEQQPKRDGGLEEDGKGKLPPLPKKGAPEAHGEEEKGGSKRSEAGESDNSNGTHQSALWSPNWSWLPDTGNKQSSGDKVSAWGLVIVTAGLGGEIRIYQNFGHPRKLGGLPTTLF